ncbi:hypothetical protein G6F31_013195 [Rhizopus arrhizus]|nr:hypothetical protein G6F31_013195 [Rhizopus arrhizus]
MNQRRKLSSVDKIARQKTGKRGKCRNLLLRRSQKTMSTIEKEIANEADKEQEVQKKHKLNNVPQLVQFLNLIYLPDDPNNNITYERQFLSMKDILSKVWECSDLFDDASSPSFNKWCNDKKLGLLNKEFIGDTIDKIINFLPKYQQHIEILKKEGYLIIGYARKSKQDVDLHVRVRLLQLMVDRLQERSLVDKTFVSVNSSSNDPLIERDSNPNDIIKKLKYVNGDMQGNTISLKTMNQMTAIGVNSTGFDKLTSTRFYSQIVRPQLEYGLAISAVKFRELQKIESCQNQCLRRIFGRASRSSIKVMLHLQATHNDTSSLLPLYGGSALKPILINLIDASSKQLVTIIYKNLLKTAVQTLTLSFSPLAVLN